MRPQVTVVGSVNRDATVAVSQFPRPGETLLGGDLAQTLGGKGANQAVAAARLGAVTCFVGAIGVDGADVRSELVEAEVGVSGLVTLEDVPTGAAFILVDDAAENMIVVSPGANARLAPAHLPAALLDGPGGVLLLQQEVPTDVVTEAARRAKDEGGTVVLNPAPSRPIALDLLDAVDVLVPNQHELAALLDAPEPEGIEDCRALLARLPEHIEACVTLGADGALARSDAEIVHIQAPRVTAVDTVGSGDTFCGALGVALGNGASFTDSVAWAVHAASIAVGYRGAQGAFRGDDDLARLGPIPV
ncbi:ribokinase [Aeromicrobium piscarium]|uniref:Ribokinase n=1 Tax=Aeromicrobium piscarium TaxID=2590901 RepID=A0A554RWB0_9ACTN|nr:ribokinase [Aeromicrobium piscarium]TSD58383.1 ribokinase [Aeromicrobium piscarium]